jgi:hypothetical protein
MLPEGFLNAPGAGGSDASVDHQRLLQVGDTFAVVAVLEVAVADAFQGACFLQRRAKVAGDGQRLAVVVAGLQGLGSSGRQFAEPVQHVSLAAPVTEVAEELEGLVVADGSSRVIAG